MTRDYDEDVVINVSECKQRSLVDTFDGRFGAAL